MKTPDIPPVTSLAGGIMSVFVAAVLVAQQFNVAISLAQASALGGLLAAVLGLVVYADLQLRKTRLANIPALMESKIATAQLTADAKAAIAEEKAKAEKKAIADKAAAAKKPAPSRASKWKVTKVAKPAAKTPAKPAA